MFTVLRILIPPGELSQLSEVVVALEVEGDIKPRPRGDGYGIRVCSEPLWADHSKAVMRFVTLNKRALALARLRGATLTVDVAVEPEDVRDQLVLTVGFSSEVVAALAEAGSQVAVSVYAGDVDSRNGQ